MFDFPIGVQLFNRPDYAKAVLESLSLQSESFGQDQLFIYIDGFKGSLYESRGDLDRTLEVEEFAKFYFPHANIKRFENNLGIADLHNQLQAAVFEGTDEWAAFFEEDVILNGHYLKELADLIVISKDFDSIVKVGCFQIIDSLTGLPRGLNGFYPGTGTKAFAERKIFFKIKQPVIAKFIEIEKLPSDDSRKTTQSAHMAAEGYFLPYFQKDSLIESFMHFHNKLHLVTKPNMATDIGFEGVHNYTTPPLRVVNKENTGLASVNERRTELAKSLDLIASESKQYAIQNFKKVLQGYHVSNSRKAMLQKVVTLTFRKNL
jgi:hypothetical protein